jgi:hypothetical protein
MSFVFISHASPDKPKIKHIVDKLVASGINVWLDNPTASPLRYGAKEIAAHFHRIRAGNAYYDQIKEALRLADVVLVCLSEHFKQAGRHIFYSEATIADYEGKLVACRIDDVDPNTLPASFAAQHVADLRIDLPNLEGGTHQSSRSLRPLSELENLLDNLVSDIRSKMLTVRFDRAQRRGARDPFIPYLVDRKDQLDAVGMAVDQIKTAGGVRPFLIAGPENECVEEFRRRLDDYYIPKVCLGGGRSWHRLMVEWPGSKGALKESYKRRLAEALGIPPSSDLQTIGARLKQLGRPANVVTLMTPGSWQDNEQRRIQEWLIFWNDLEVAARGFAAVPMLCMTFPPAKPGWKDCPTGRANSAVFDNEVIWAMIKRLATPTTSQRIRALILRPSGESQLHVPPMLQPLRADHVETWLADHVDGTNQERASQIKSKLFLKAKYGLVPLRDFATGMAEIFRDAINDQTWRTR